VYVSVADVGFNLSTQPTRLSMNCPPCVYLDNWVVHFTVSPNGVLKVAEDNDSRFGLYGLAIFVLFDCLGVHGRDDGDMGVLCLVFLEVYCCEGTVIAEGAIDLIVGVRSLH
jgi:hypothetical protein